MMDAWGAFVSDSRNTPVQEVKVGDATFHVVDVEPQQ